jgi:hypothetical protein
MDRRLAVGAGIAIGVATGIGVARHLLSRAVARKVIETSISLSAPDRAEVGKAFMVSGTLLAIVDGTVKPLDGETVELYVDSGKVTTATTSSGGKYAINITISREGTYRVTARYPGRVADSVEYRPSEASATVSVSAPSPPPPGAPPQPPQYSVTVSASSDKLAEDPSQFLTVKVCWDNYTLPPASGDYYQVSAASEDEGCSFDSVLIKKDWFKPSGCAEFTRRFLDEYIPDTGSWYYPCLKTIRGAVDGNRSSNTVYVERVERYSVDDISGLSYDPSTGSVVLVMKKPVSNMAIIYWIWTADAYGRGCRWVTEPGRNEGRWVSGDRVVLRTGVYPQDIKIDTFVCSEKYVAVRLCRPGVCREWTASMR